MLIFNGISPLIQNTVATTTKLASGPFRGFVVCVNLEQHDSCRTVPVHLGRGLVLIESSLSLSVSISVQTCTQVASPQLQLLKISEFSLVPEMLPTHVRKSVVLELPPPPPKKKEKLVCEVIEKNM